MSDPAEVRRDAERQMRRDLARRLAVPIAMGVIGIALIVIGVILL